MRARSLLSFVLWALPLGAGCGVTGPSGDELEPVYGEDVDGDGVPDDAVVAGYEAGTFDKNDVLSDGELTDADSLTVSEVQAFLDHNPYGWQSVLATHTTGGKSAAQAIIDAAAANEISPIVVLTRLQLEQSLIGKKTATQKALDYAMGCGCPDGQPCNPAYKGFGKQVDCMASKFRSYLDDMDAGGTTVAGWDVGKTKSTLDGYSVTPVNMATAAIYTYTPHVSSAKNHRKIWALYADYVGYDGPTTPADPPPDDGGGDGTTDPVPLDIIVDNGAAADDLAAFDASTAWSLGTSAAGKYGTSYTYRSTGASADAARFKVFLETDRVVTIQAWWTAGSNRSKTAPFVIYDAAGNKLGTATVNQQQSGGMWVTLGTFSLTAGWNTIALSRWTTAGYVVVADAVRVTAP